MTAIVALGFVLVRRRWRLLVGLFVAGTTLAAGAIGKVMAGDPKWCRSLAGWMETYDGWLRRMEAQDAADLSIFLDFRLVRGDASLVGEMRRHVHATLPEQRGVQFLLARNALAFRPPLRLPGNIYLGGASESSGRFDLKDALQPIVAFARVYSERQRIVATHTMERMCWWRTLSAPASCASAAVSTTRSPT